jgi:hypothetical protein
MTWKETLHKIYSGNDKSTEQKRSLKAAREKHKLLIKVNQAE